MPKPDPLSRRLVDACMELYRRRSWQRTEIDAPFLLRLPDEADPLVGILTGQSGTEFGLSFLRGPDALSSLHRLVQQGIVHEPETEEFDSISICFERLGEIPDELRGPLQAARFQTRRESIAPMLFTKPPHRRLRPPSRGEMKAMLWGLIAIFAAEDRGDLQARRLSPGRKILELEITGTFREPRLSTRFVPWSPRRVADRPAPVLLPVDLASLPRTEETWIATSPPLPAYLEDDERSWRGLVVSSLDSGELLGADLVPSEDTGGLVEPISQALRAAGLPREIVFAQEPILDALAPALATLGVKVRLDPALPEFEQLHEMYREVAKARSEPPWAGDAPETLEEWKRAELDYTHRQVDRIARREAITPRALTRYFGSEAEAEELLEELSELNPMAAFIEWLAADYRATKRSKPLLEQWLEERRLDPIDRELIEARRAALFSIFHVVSTQPGASFEVEDVLEGSRYTVQDRALSGCGIDGFYLPLRLLRIREWYFPLLAGPPFNAMQVDRALARLEAFGVVLDHDGMREGAHLTGGLWRFFLKARAQKPVLQNTDGDPLEWHRASFHVTDPRAFAKALERRADVEVDEPGTAWTWSREGGPAPGFERTTLGRLELFDDALLLEVNSKRRLERGRRWLEALPGVRFEEASRAGPGEAPLDDRLPGPPPQPLDPELLAHVERIIADHARRWLDESLPALGGLTPRAACATEEGRRRVARLIRTMPPARVPGGEVAPPREELLRELGLGG